MIREQNTLVIATGSGDLVYYLSRGGYSVQKGAISISVETEAKSRSQFPDCVLIALEGHPVAKDLKMGDVFECSGGMSQNDYKADSTKAHGYFTFHAERISVRWTIRAINDDGITFELESVHDDVVHYDSRARATPTRGLFTLKRQPKSRLWIPG